MDRGQPAAHPDPSGDGPVEEAVPAARFGRAGERAAQGHGVGTKRQRIEAYLDRLSSEQLQNLTLRELTAALANDGLEVTERYVKHILDQRRPTPTPKPHRRGSSPRSPRR
jgi:hypothetical protein